MDRTCKGCGGIMSPALFPQARYCNILCRRRAFRLRHPEQARMWVREANRRRYHRDPEFRRHSVARTRRWRRVQAYGHDVGDNPLNHTKDHYRAARALGYRSGLEVVVANDLKKRGVEFKYEPFRIPFMPRKARFYKPDIVLANGIILELKGRFQTADRTKHLYVKEQHPRLDVRFVFSNPNQRISKQSHTTYAVWCDSHGFKYCSAKTFALSWLTEPSNADALAAMRELSNGK